uniref:Calmodulin n=1 Tax=Aureoumbra lagunensis TaxID=44058 RepID=A0A6S8BZ12_9STRA
MKQKVMRFVCAVAIILQVCSEESSTPIPTLESDHIFVVVPTSDVEMAAQSSPDTVANDTTTQPTLSPTIMNSTDLPTASFTPTISPTESPTLGTTVEHTPQLSTWTPTTLQPTTIKSTDIPTLSTTTEPTVLQTDTIAPTEIPTPSYTAEPTKIVSTVQPTETSTTLKMTTTPTIFSTSNSTDSVRIVTPTEEPTIKTTNTTPEPTGTLADGQNNSTTLETPVPTAFPTYNDTTTTSTAVPTLVYTGAPQSTSVPTVNTTLVSEQNNSIGTQVPTALPTFHTSTSTPTTIYTPTPQPTAVSTANSTLVSEQNNSVPTALPISNASTSIPTTVYTPTPQPTSVSTANSTSAQEHNNSVGTQLPTALPISNASTSIPTTVYTPTPQPTSIPTANSTRRPTALPTIQSSTYEQPNINITDVQNSTELPSPSTPTENPTSWYEPTSQPTVAKTSVPTITSIYTPTSSLNETIESTRGPSNDPTIWITETPTILPTPAPTALPTPLPSELPTFRQVTPEPTEASTVNQSIQPTIMRTHTPTRAQNNTATLEPTSIPYLFSASLVFDLGIRISGNSSIASVMGAAVVRAVDSIKSVDSSRLSAYNETARRRLTEENTAATLSLTGTAQTSDSDASMYIENEISSAISSGDLGSALVVEIRAANILNGLDNSTIQSGVLVNESIQMLANTVAVSVSTSAPTSTPVPTVTPIPMATLEPTAVVETTPNVTQAPTYTSTEDSGSSKKKKSALHLTPVTLMLGIGLLVLLFCVALPTLITCYRTRVPKTVVHVERYDDVPPPMELDEMTPKPKGTSLNYATVFGEDEEVEADQGEEQSPLAFRGSPDVEAPNTPLTESVPIMPPTPPSRSKEPDTPVGLVGNETSVLTAEWEQMMNDVDGGLEEEEWNEEVASLILFRSAATANVPEGFAPRAQLTTMLEARPDLTAMLGLGSLSPSDIAELFVNIKTDEEDNVSRNQFIQAVGIYRNRFGIIDMDTVDTSATPPQQHDPLRHDLPPQPPF